ncbi:cold-shock DNA-binding protein family [Rubrobacter xylanophilus DSM 9941]|uniref:Cold-shock DNA-binding protein family n=1 Tax=Rubrobacter xylanophilus (strain DSM 9941 / JCM 11954 / NBRC 16129 / PRD-1) TaxID=266117 RepID=Q1AY27_RUBXD|nr:cold shock domain-containing protein [Rubrobacter xylanophilus]ABG03701.1 cold-shock DNA-binding protein family [Rubrobacter xylanophilus DSM 9941]
MGRGRVKWFSGEKGFGFIETESGEEVLVHYTEIKGEGFRALEEGAEVEYAAVKTEDGRRRAFGVRMLPR